MSVAICIGNGESRQFLNLHKLKEQATLIGCNAIHRDINVDHIVCCDKRMVAEVLAHKKSKIPFIYTRERYYQDYNKLESKKRVVRLPDLPYQGTYKVDQPEHWGSGPYAVLLASELGFKTVYMIGFDLYGKGYQVNNIYKNTNCYLPESANAIDPSFWVYQIKKIFDYYPNTTFKVFNNREWKMPQDWTSSNLEYFDIQNIHEELAKEINILYT